MAGQPGGSAGIDDAFARAWAPGTGAEIMGRAKSGPHRGPWPDRQRTGWRGDDPPFRAPVLVRTRPLRPAVRMNGGTRSGFPDASPARAVAQPRRAAAGAGVRIGGGPAAIREFLAAGLIDYAHIVVVPIVPGRGERLRDGLEGLDDRFRLEAVTSPGGVTHVTLSRR